MPRRPIDFWALVEGGSPTQCWPWLGRLDESGYGRVGKWSIPAHRLMYEHAVGPIPKGLELDHLCHTRDLSCCGGVSCPHRRCVNPKHLEVVTHKVNAHRGRSFAAVNAAKTHCPQGHPYDEENTYVYDRPGVRARFCRTCVRAGKRRLETRVA